MYLQRRARRSLMVKPFIVYRGQRLYECDLFTDSHTPVSPPSLSDTLKTGSKTDSSVCVCVCVCAHARTYTICQEQTLCMFYTCEVRTFNQERTHSRSAVAFNFRFGLVILENPRIDHKIMGVA